MENRRIGMGPIPPVPKDYLTEQQVTKLAILKKFGWILVCIRRPAVGVKEVVASKWFMLPALPSPRWFVLTMG
ncbi:MAG: hypothetical protein KZQ92_09240 [Candidatus Thiodiazotropha sp. (ex Lucinoma borealis)]|nr:hypothetical protein [Candidatus Thiodiazotropha sp. (ex Lucinoma borealis)]